VSSQRGTGVDKPSATRHGPAWAFSELECVLMDISGLTTFFTAILDTLVRIAGLVAAVALAAAGFMYFGVIGHNQRAMEMAQGGVRAAFIGLAFVWGARELINLVAGAAGQPGLGALPTPTALH
jgi:hypothetical protein